MAVVGARGVTTGRATPDVPSGTSNDSVSQKEDLANFISMITRDETPFMSSIGKTKATAIFHEWQTDELAAPGDSTVVEGLDYIVPTAYAQAQNTGNFPDFGPTGTGTDGLPTIGTNTAGTSFAYTGPNRTRLGNYTQINGKSIAVSGTRRAIDQVGVADEYAYQLKKRGTELRRDLERDLIHTYQPTSSGGTRKMGGFQSWINNPLTVELNGATAAGTTNLTLANGTTAPTLTSARVSLSLSDIDATMQKIYEAGGKAGKIMLSPKLRRDFSDLMVTDSGVRRNIDMDGKLRQSVDIYMSDFGDLMVVPNYIMGLNHAQGTPVMAATTTNNTKDSCALIYDPMWFSVATLRPLQEVDVGQRGDSTIGMMIEECTFEVKNPIGCGAIYNLN